MRIIKVDNYEAMSQEAFGIVKSTVCGTPNAVLGLATGSTPMGLYKLMTEDRKKNGTSYKGVRTVNLDEYKGLPASHEQSYAYFMRKNLFCGLDIDPANVHIENGMAQDEREECERYDGILESLPRNIQILGLGRNGHIAFNEPYSPFGSTTRVVDLTESTVNDNSRLFSDRREVPRKAFTMGIKSIMQSKKIVLLASGANKADALYKMINGPVTEEVPASVLQLHPNCIVIADAEACAKL